MNIFNIEKGLELPKTFKILHEAMDDLYTRREEDFQKDNPLKEIYKTYPLNQFQKTFASDIGFKKAFEATVDYASYPKFTSNDGFKATISYTPFNGSVAITWQLLLEGDMAGWTSTLNDYQIAWQRQVVEHGMFALTAFFTGKAEDPVAKVTTFIKSADTVDGDPMGEVKNTVISKNHTIVRTKDMTDEQFNKMKQSNKFYVDITLDGSDPLAYAKLSDAIYQIKVRMNKLFDDNGKRAGLRGRKKLVCTEDAHLNQALNSILAADNFSCTIGSSNLNPMKGGFDTYYTPYLDGNEEQPIPQFAVDESVGYGRGILILDPEYNNSNKGPMMVERVKFSMDVNKTKNPEGIEYLGKQAYSFACPNWRGVSYLYIGKPNGATGKWNDETTFTKIIPAVSAKPVSIVGTVTTKAEA